MKRPQDLRTAEWRAKYPMLSEKDGFGNHLGTMAAAINAAMSMSPQPVREIAAKCGIKHTPRVDTHMQYLRRRGLAVHDSKGGWRLTVDASNILRSGSQAEESHRKPVPPELNHPETMPEGVTYQEGAVRPVLVNVYERDRKARDECIRHHGTTCAVCEMSFEEHYGDIGKGFIHVHHKKPIATCGGSYQLNAVEDLVPVCPNCHAMLHTSDPPLSVKELKAKIKRQELPA